jgi:ketosteroid isomerase-like protein
VIAISYRREDSLPITGRLYDRLQAEFGRTEVFMDFDSIPYGMDFRAHIKQTLERASVVVAVIGPSWTGPQSNSTRRIDDPRDFVRLEIAAALERGIPIIPVLVNGSVMPAAEGLPKEIEALSFRNGLELDSGIDFHHHADRLIAGICDHLKKTRPSSRALGKRAEKKRAPLLSARSVATVVAGIGITALVYFGLLFMRGRSGVPQERPFISTQADATPAVLARPTAVAQPTAVAIEAPPPSQPTPNPTAVPSAINEEHVRQFIRDYYSAFARHDVDAVIAAFADTVDYQGEGLRNKQQIRAEAEAYLRRWNKILFAVEYISVSRTTNGDFTASFNAPFSVSTMSSAPVMGVSVNNWVLRQDPYGHLRIIFQREKVQSLGEKRR